MAIAELCNVLPQIVGQHLGRLAIELLSAEGRFKVCAYISKIR